MIPAFVNARAGTHTKAADALQRAGGFDVHTVEPTALEARVRETIAASPSRIAVAGGDGTIATAAAVILDTPPRETALAVIPGGTLNHFAKDHGIPLVMDEAAQVAAGGSERRADVAFAGERLFLNTSSVGAYVTYVRIRDRLEQYVGYRLASLAALVRLFFVMRPVRVELDVDGERRTYDTPLVFIGVGERELKAPTLGARVRQGEHKLHVMVVRERRAARLLSVALAAFTRGVASVSHTPDVDSFLVDRCAIGLGPSPTSRSRHRERTQRTHRVPRVAVDGEIVHMQAPVEYRIERDALSIVVP